MRFLCITLTAVAALPLFAEDGTLLAESGDSPEFSVYSASGATYSAAKSASSEIAALPPVFSRAGETVTATPPSGSNVKTLSSPSLVSVLDEGGVWSLFNSVQGSARIGVAWAVYDDGGTLASSASSGDYGVDSKQPGPDRKARLENMLPVSYSGDNWVRDVSAAATLTFVSPDGDETVLNLTGAGATTQFRFDKSGSWTVTLTMADGATRTALINVSGGLVISFT